MARKMLQRHCVRRLPAAVVSGELQKPQPMASALKNGIQTSGTQKMKKNKIALGLAALAVSGSALAAPVFSDEFNRSNANNLGGDWSEIERNGNDVAISGNALQLRDNRGVASASSPDAAATFSVSTLGLEDLFLSFAWAPLIASEDEDVLNVSWRTGDNAWTNIWSSGLGGDGGWSSANVELGASAADLESIDIRFWTEVNVSWWFIFWGDSTADEGARIDWISLTGNPIPAVVTPPVSDSQPVPEPTTLALLGLGLAGLGALRRKQRAA
ncbi:MAG: PEP-CTERM sorting domain-containing protein [Thauera propionica]|nr:PEP-CTERM sorting domain-containing protein [Thauera propionica]